MYFFVFLRENVELGSTGWLRFVSFFTDGGDDDFDDEWR